MNYIYELHHCDFVPNYIVCGQFFQLMDGNEKKISALDIESELSR